LVLEPMSPAFVTERYLGWLRDPEVTRFLSSRDYSIDQLGAYVAERSERDDVRFWAVCESGPGNHIGNVKLEPIDWVAGNAVFGLMIGEKSAWGKGYASETTSLVVEYAFEDLSLRRVELGVELENQAAVRAYQKAGFRIAREVTYASPTSNGSMGKFVLEICKE